MLGEAKAAAEAALVAAYRELPDGQLLGLALKDLAGNLPPIGSLTVTPDLLLLAWRAARAAAGGRWRRRPSMSCHPGSCWCTAGPSSTN